MPSLLDALFLEEPLFPNATHRKVWIALRAAGDGYGSGTENDPWSGGLASPPPAVLSVSSIQKTGSAPLEGLVALVNCSNHGYKNGDIVVISGAEDPDSLSYNGTFAIYDVLTNSFKYNMVKLPGGNAVGNNLTCTLDPYLFDAVMRKLALSAAPTTIHIGPGTFSTKGYSGNAPASWQPRSSWKIVGSGMNETVLKIVGGTMWFCHYVAIGNNYQSNILSGFEVSDLTVDCNLSGQPIAVGDDFAPVTCGAVLAGGSHIRISRVRAINFGTQQANVECFVITTGAAMPGYAK